VNSLPAYTIAPGVKVSIFRDIKSSSSSTALKENLMKSPYFRTISLLLNKENFSFLFVEPLIS
jgi:hypothetical protein